MLTRFKIILSLHYKLFLCILILLETFLLIFTFTTKREGFHSDENWSYGYANSFYQRHIYLDSKGNQTNINEWFDSSILRDYIEVSSNQRFRFDSVFSNMSEDYSPPLHSLILHTICSFFPNTFSWWYGFSINIVAFILSIWLLFFIAKKLFHSISLPYIICIFYGFSSAAINCFIFIRTYALLTFFALCFIYLLIILMQKKKKDFKVLFLIFTITVLGCLSHYFYYAFAFFLSVAVCLSMLVQKKYKLLIAFIGTMLTAVALALIIFPSTIHMVMKGFSLYTMHMPLSWEIKFCLSLCFWETGWGIPPYPTQVTWCILKFVCIFILILLSGFLFLFRKETWLITYCKKIKTSIYTLFKSFPQILIQILCSFWFSLLFTFSLTIIVIAKISNVYLMGIFADRYLFFLMPIFDLCLIKFVYSLLQHITKHIHHTKLLSRTFLTLVLATSLIATQATKAEHYYFKRGTSAPTLTSLSNNSNVIVVLNSNYEWHYTCYTTLLRNSKKIFVCAPNSNQKLSGLKSALEKLNNNSSVYLIMEKESLGGAKQNSGSFNINNSDEGLSKLFTSGYTERELLDFFSSCTWCTTSKKIQTEKSFQGELDVYQLR